jgi:hypothetical protein
VNSGPDDSTAVLPATEHLWVLLHEDSPSVVRRARSASSRSAANLRSPSRAPREGSQLLTCKDHIPEHSPAGAAEPLNIVPHKEVGRVERTGVFLSANLQVTRVIDDHSLI